MKLRSKLIYRVDCDDGLQHMTAFPRQRRDGQEMTRNVFRNNQHNDRSAVRVPYLWLSAVPDDGRYIRSIAVQHSL